jgi:hypothetical protein
MNRILLSLFFGLISYTAAAQVSWQKVSGPNETVTAVTAASNNMVYIGTVTYGVFSSADDGTTWSNISLGLGDSAISNLQMSSDDKLYAGTSAHGLYVYTAGSWSAINNGLPSNTQTVSAFAKGAAGTIYMMSGSGKIYSWNGIIWTDITNNFPSLGRGLAVGPTGILYATAFASGVYKFDGISNWTIVGAAMSNNFVTKISVSNSDTIYVACNSNNVFCCPAAGGNWTLINTGLPVSNMNFIATDAQNNIYVATNTANGAVYRSMNGGASWVLISSTLYTTTFYCFATTSSGKIYTGASGVFMSVNRGVSWNDLNPGLNASRTVTSYTCTKAGTMFLGTRLGPWRSKDNGNTWQLRNTNITHLYIVQLLEDAAGDILCHGINNTPKGAIYRSTDNGDSWTLVAANGCDQYTKIKQHKSDTIWAASRFSGATSLSYSIDNGAHWVNNPLRISAIWDIDFTKENTILLGSESEGVSRSDDGGQTFTLGVGNTIPWYGNVIGIETDVNGVIFAGGDWWTHILWFSASTENGDVWTQFTDPDLVISGLQDMVFDLHNNAYIAAENNGVRMAYNTTWTAGTDWLQSNTGFPSPTSNIAQLGFDTLGYIYAVCYSSNGHDAGLYRSTAAVNPPNSSIYTFTGNGNWNVAANWSNNTIPPSTITGNQMIVIDPPLNGECVLNVQQHVNNNAIFKVMPNKKIRISSDCVIAQ